LSAVANNSYITHFRFVYQGYDECMKYYKTKSHLVDGDQYKEVEKNARLIYKQIAAKSKRNPYIGAPYFNKEKVFIEIFWTHLFQKSKTDRKRRLRYFSCAIELMHKSTIAPDTCLNPNGNGNTLNRFYGTARTGHNFIVQISKDRRTGDKYLMSILPEK
jgi:hypothetical protein